jgi:hypothetical protein
MARDIEEFLRRAAERRNQQVQQQKQAQPKQPSQRLREVISEVEIVEPSPTMRQQGVAEHVRTHINTSEIAKHARNLGERIQNVDDAVAERLGSKFDRDFSKMDNRATITDDGQNQTTRDDSSQIARELVQMLKSPATVRQAIVVSEILKRPDFEE